MTARQKTKVCSSSCGDAEIHHIVTSKYHETDSKAVLCHAFESLSRYFDVYSERSAHLTTEKLPQSQIVSL